MKIKPSISEIKEKSLDMLRGRWKTAVILTVFYTLFNGVVMGLETQFAEAGVLLVILTALLTFVEVFLDLGLRIGMLQYSRGEMPSVGCIFDASRYYLKALCYYVPVNVAALLLSNGSLFLSGYLFKQASAAMSFGLFFLLVLLMLGFSVLSAGLMPVLFLILDRPELSVGQLWKTAWRLMRGNKIKLLLMQFSFFGWLVLCMFTFGIGMLFLTPYMYVAECTFYNQLLLEDGQQQNSSEPEEEQPAE